MIKIGNKLAGETPEEQIKLERKRFDKRQEHKKVEKQARKVDFLKRGEGNKKLQDDS